MIDPIMSRKAVMAACSISTATLARRMEDGKFPRPLRITETTIGWKESTIQKWIDTREVIPA